MSPPQHTVLPERDQRSGSLVFLPMVRNQRDRIKAQRNCAEPPGRASKLHKGQRLSRMEVLMNVLPKTPHRPLTICQRIAIPGAISLLMSAVCATSPGDVDKSNHTLDSISSTARQSSGSNTRTPERSVQKEQDPNGHQDREAGRSHEELSCGEGAIAFQSANNVVYSTLPVEAPIGPEIQTLRNPKSEQSDGRASKFVPTFLGASPTSVPARRTQTGAGPSCMRRVTITSNPCGATIYINRIQTGETPMSFPVPPGRYTLHLLAPGHQMYAQWILVADGPLEIKANLVPDR